MSAFRQLVATQTNATTGTTASVTLAGDTTTSRTIRFANIGTETVWVEFGYGTAATAVASTSIPILANTVEAFRVGPRCDRYAHIAATTGSTLSSTVGEGD